METMWDILTYIHGKINPDKALMILLSVQMCMAYVVVA